MEQNKDFVPKLNGYIARKIGKTTDVEILKKAWEQRQNTMLVGETGTGKTHAVRHVCYELGLPYMRVNLNGGTTVEDLVGQITPAIGGGFKWQDGVLTRFMRHGGVVVFDEINMASPDILAILNPVLDDERKLVLVQNDGEVILAHKDCWFVTTMNPDYEGTKTLNASLKDRWEVNLEFRYDDAIEKELIGDEAVLKVAQKLRAMFEKGEIVTPISTRTLLMFKKNIRIYGEDVAVEMLTNRFDKDEVNAVAAVLEVIVGKKQSSFKK